MKITEQSVSLISNLLLYEYKQFLHFLYMSIKFHLINDRVKPANNSLELTKLIKYFKFLYSIKHFPIFKNRIAKNVG